MNIQQCEKSYLKGQKTSLGKNDLYFEVLVRPEVRPELTGEEEGVYDLYFSAPPGGEQDVLFLRSLWSHSKNSGKPTVISEKIQIVVIVVVVKSLTNLNTIYLFYTSF